jgi:NADPH-dependent curcumin reductase CurA
LAYIFGLMSRYYCCMRPNSDPNGHGPRIKTFSWHCLQGQKHGFEPRDFRWFAMTKPGYSGYRFRFGCQGKPRMQNSNHRFLLKARPAGIAGPEHFQEDVQPVRLPDVGELLLESVYISIDPAMRVWVSENPGYVPPVELGTPMRAGGIGRVLVSGDPNFKPGDFVNARLGWQSHPTVRASDSQKLDLSVGSPRDWIGPLGTTALTAYFGLFDVGAVQPGETVLVSAAAGGVGQMAAQMAKIRGCRVVGIAGGPQKCGYLREELGLDAVIDYKMGGLADAYVEALPNGCDVFFDNVGGEQLDLALAHLREKGRVAICGRISQTASTELYGVKNLGLLIGKRAKMQGFIVFDYNARYPEARAWIGEQLKAGRLRQRLHVLEGLSKAPEGLGMLFRGENQGKLVVQVASE